MLQGLRQDVPNYQQMMMRNQQNGMQMSQENMLRQKALQNQRNAYVFVSARTNVF